MTLGTAKFSVSFVDGVKDAPVVMEKDAILLGRLASCDVVLDHKAVSRIHAGINFLDSTFFLINLSSSNLLTLNGRALGPGKSDVLAQGDIFQIGPFLVTVSQLVDEIGLSIERLSTDDLGRTTRRLPPVDAVLPSRVGKEQADVLKVFWEKRTREKEDWGTRLRPAERPQPGKALINWKPTGDLRRPWRGGLFIWTFLILGAVAVLAFLYYPETYASKPLANPHAVQIENSPIAVRSNGNSCTTCHAPNTPIENACIQCHQAERFHPSNTKAHEEAGVTCTSCHREHQGTDFDMKASAVQSCAECHNDANKRLYNARMVRTAHDGSYGYPVEAGVWKWKGVYREVAAGIPEINGSATGDANEQAMLSRHFHSVHVYRLKAPHGLKSDSRGLVSCSTCHNSFTPIDRDTPRQTCAACHTTASRIAAASGSPGAGVNCISCHVQHPYSVDRWSEFLTGDALKRRRDSVAAQIAKLRE